MSATPERLQKIIARAGLGSRREADEWIQYGEVTVNGKIAVPGQLASLTDDAIKVRGKLLTRQETPVTYLFHKPKGVLCTLGQDLQARMTLSPYLRGLAFRVSPIGRMGFNESGLVLLTNRGDLKKRYNESIDVVHVYRVKTASPPSSDQLQRLHRGMRVDEVWVEPKAVVLESHLSKKAFLLVEYGGPMPSQFAEFARRRGVLVDDIRRIGIGQLKLTTLKPGELKLLRPSQIEALVEHTELGERDFKYLAEKVPAKRRARRIDREHEGAAAKIIPVAPRDRLLTTAPRSSKPSGPRKFPSRGGAVR